MKWPRKKKGKSRVAIAKKFKKVTPKIEEPILEEKQEKVEKVNPGGPLCHCGEPVAPGQTEVCQGHIRRG